MSTLEKRIEALGQRARPSAWSGRTEDELRRYVALIAKSIDDSGLTPQKETELSGLYARVPRRSLDRKPDDELSKLSDEELKERIRPMAERAQMTVV